MIQNGSKIRKYNYDMNMSPVNSGCEIVLRQSRVKACQRDKNVKHKLKYT